MVEGCGHEVPPGARFCGACGAPAGRDEGAPGEDAPSTPWPAGRRSGAPVPIDKTPTVSVGLTTPFAAGPGPRPPAGPTPAPLPPNPGGAPTPTVSTLDRRTPFILGVLVLALVVAVLALSFKVMSSSDGREDERVASVTTTDPVEESESSAQTAPATSAPPVSPSIPATTVLPPAEPSTTESSSSAPPSTTAPLVAYSDELVSALDGYITALDQGDIELAYSYVAVSLRVQDGWDHGTFSTFWTESVVGAEVVSVDDVSTSTGAITLTVDYALPEGATSRESVVATFAPAGDAGFLVMVDYEVLDTERIG